MVQLIRGADRAALQRAIATHSANLAKDDGGERHPNDWMFPDFTRCCTAIGSQQPYNISVFVGTPLGPRPRRDPNYPWTLSCPSFRPPVPPNQSSSPTPPPDPSTTDNLTLLLVMVAIRVHKSGTMRMCR